MNDKVKQFSPDLLALSCTEDMFHLGINLLRRTRYRNILTIAGGVFPTFAPELVLSYDEIDIVCKGEGENALLELCSRLKKGQDYYDIQNLWLKIILFWTHKINILYAFGFKNLDFYKL